MNRVFEWFNNVFRVWRRECYLVLHDGGVMLFFFALPLLYPIVYTLIYNPEIVEKMPVAVVDNCRSAESRQLVRMADGTQAIDVAGYAADMQEARRWMNEHKVVAVMEIPENYSDKQNSGSQATVQFYCDMSLLLRYRTFLMTLTQLQLAAGAQIQAATIDKAGLLGQTVVGGDNASPLNTQAIMLGDPTQGFASFVIPGILVLIIQQSLILGVTMLAAGGRSRRRRNLGIDPLAIPASPGATIVGKLMCYLMIYIPMLIYTLHFVPLMFSLPHIGHLGDYILFMLPMLVASVFMGMSLAVFVTERESSLAVVVFTSVVFLFLTGLTWPRYAMSGFWTAVGNMVPAVWGVEGFIRMNSNGSTLAEQQHPYMMLWVLSLVYFVTAYLVERYNSKPLRLQRRATADSRA